MDPATLAIARSDLDRHTTNAYVAKAVPAIDGDTLTAADIYDLLDTIPAGDKVTKTLLGYDASGTLPVYRYVFTPKVYRQTAIIIANIHGDGEGVVGGDAKVPAIALYHLLARTYLPEGQGERQPRHDHPLLEYLRHQVQLVVIPVANPYGFNNNTRQNANGVDLNRNFDAAWSGGGSPGDENYPGASPFSEVESQYIRDTMIAYPKAKVFLDWHSHDTHTVEEHPTYMGIIRDTYAGAAWAEDLRVAARILQAKRGNAIAGEVPVVDVAVTTSTTNGSTTTYAKQVMRYPRIATIEWTPSVPELGGPYSSLALTLAHEWYANTLLTAVAPSQRTKAHDGVWVPAPMLKPYVGNPTESTLWKNPLWVLPDSGEAGVTAIAMVPREWHTVKVYAYWFQRTGNTGNVRFTCGIRSQRDETSYAEAPARPAKIVAPGAAHIIQRTEVGELGINHSGLVSVWLHRDPAHASDTLGADVYLMGLEIVEV